MRGLTKAEKKGRKMKRRTKEKKIEKLFPFLFCWKIKPPKEKGFFFQKRPHCAFFFFSYQMQKIKEAAPFPLENFVKLKWAARLWEVFAGTLASSKSSGINRKVISCLLKLVSKHVNEGSGQIKGNLAGRNSN